MSAKKAKTTQEKGTEEGKAEGLQGCPCMPSGEMPDCCGPGMREMMAQFMGRFQAKEEK